MHEIAPASVFNQQKVSWCADQPCQHCQHCDRVVEPLCSSVALTRCQCINATLHCQISNRIKFRSLARHQSSDTELGEQPNIAWLLLPPPAWPGDQHDPIPALCTISQTSTTRTAKAPYTSLLPCTALNSHVASSRHPASILHPGSLGTSSHRGRTATIERCVVVARRQHRL